MPEKRKKVNIIIFSFCVLLVAFAVYQMYEMIVSSGHVEDLKKARINSQLQKIAKPGSEQIILRWDTTRNAKSYNVYWSKTPGVNKHNGNKISNVTNPATIKDLEIGITYYFVVTAVNESGESAPSGEIAYTVENNKY